MASGEHNKRGFTLIELLISIAIIGVIATLVMVGQRNNKALQRDVQRTSHMTEVQKALALYMAAQGAYPTYDGCLDGTDPVTTALIAQKLIGVDAHIVDPLFPNDEHPDWCYAYTGSGDAFTLKYYLEKKSATGKTGEHLIVP